MAEADAVEGIIYPTLFKDIFHTIRQNHYQNQNDVCNLRLSYMKITNKKYIF